MLYYEYKEVCKLRWMCCKLFIDNFLTLEKVLRIQYKLYFINKHVIPYNVQYCQTKQVYYCFEQKWCQCIVINLLHDNTSIILISWLFFDPFILVFLFIVVFVGDWFKTFE